MLKSSSSAASNRTLVVASAAASTTSGGTSSKAVPQTVTAVSWLGGSGNWATAADWSPSGVPGSSSAVTIAAAGTYTVSITAPESAASLTINNATATVAESGAITMGGTLALNAGTFTAGGTITGGTISVAAGADFRGAGGTLSGVVFDGTLDLTQDRNDNNNAASLTITGGTTFAGAGGTGAATINIASNHYNGDATLSVAGTATLDNATINIGGGTNYGTILNLDNAGTGAVLTLGTKLVINQTGRFASLASSDATGDAIVNKGTISADYAGGTFQIDATTFTNSGTVTVSANDQLLLTGTISAALINGIGKSGGGLVDIAGTVSGGTINAANGGIEGGGGTLSGVVFDGTLDLTQDRNDNNNAASLTITGGTTFAGAGGTGAATINIASNHYNGDATLSVAGTATLDNATINIGGGTNYGTILNLDNAGTGAVLTLGTKLVINQTGRFASLASSDATGDAIVNKGTISADYAGGTFQIDATTFTNSGTVTVSANDQLLLTGTISAALINGIGKSGGGLVDIAGTVSGGTINAANGGIEGGGGTLSGVVFDGTLDLTQDRNDNNNAASLTITGGTTFAGAGGTGAATINIASNHYNGDATLSVAGTATLDNATINIGGGTNYGTILNLDNAGTGAVLTLGTKLVINQTGRFASLASSDATGDAIVNKGTISADYAGGTFQIDATTFTNSGTVTVSANDQLLLTGTISAALINGIGKSGGGLVDIAGTVSGGTINAANGGIEGGGGTLSGVVFDGTLDLTQDRNDNNNAASLTITGGTTFAGAGGTGAATINIASNHYNGDATLSVAGTATLDNATINIGGGTNYGTILNLDNAGTGAVLTLGTKLVINQTGRFAGFSSSNLIGDAIVNNGTIIAAYSSGQFQVSATKFTNNGTISVQGGDTFTIQSTSFTNLVGATLTGGTYTVGANSVLQLAPNTRIATLAATLTLSGAGSTVEGLNTTSNVQATVDANLVTVAAGGTLSLLAGRSLKNSNAMSDQGSIVLNNGTLGAKSLGLTNLGQLFGYGAIIAPITDNTLIEANGGTLAITGAVGGSGTLQIDAGATLSLSAGLAATNTITFNGARATAQFATPSAIAGPLQNFGAADSLNLGTFTATSAAISGSSLTVGLSTGATLTFALTGAFASERVGISTDGHTLTAYRTAQATHAPEPVAFANHHVGDAVSTPLTLTNSAAKDGYSEKLDASVGTLSGAATGSGSVNQLAAGASNATAITVGLATTTSGALTGTAVLNLMTDGSGTDGGAALSIGTQTVNVTGSVYAYAAPQLGNGGTVALGNHHVGDVVSGGLSLTNTAATNGYSEALDAALANASAGFTATGSLTRLAAGATNATALTLGLVTTSAGAVSGTAQVNLTSDGTGIDGLGTTALASQTVNVTGAVYNYAAGKLASTVLALGSHRVGDIATTKLSLTNSAATGSYSEALDAAIGALSGGLVGFGTLSGLAAGATNNTALTVGLSTAAAGAIAGTATIGLTSDGSGGDGLGTTALTSQTVKITGAVYNAAVGKLASSSLAFGNHHVGDTVSGALSLTNGAAAGSYSEALDAALSSSATSLSASGTVTGLLAGASNASALVVGLKTATAGAVSATATLALSTDGTNIDGLGTAALAAQSVAVSGAVYNEASATLASATINLGVVHVGQSVTQALSLTNAAPTGSYTEALDASFGGSGTGLLTSGTVTGLKAGGTDATDLTVGIGTSTSGVVSGKTSLTLLSDGAGIDGLGTTALAAQSIAVSGTVDNYAVAAFQDPQGPQITGSGTNYTLNLGTVAQGGTALSATLGVLNAATGLADLLGGSIATNGATGFTNTGFGAFSGLGAGQGETAQSISLATNAAGTFSETIALSAAGSNASGYSGALPAETLTVTGTVTPVQPNVYTLANGPNTITGAAGGDLFIAGAGAINSRDTLTGGSGANVLQLTGAGTFDLSAPKAINGIQTIDAYEGQAATGAAASTQQIVYLRSTAAETVNVLGSTPAAGNTSPEGTTIYGGTMADTINLGQGADTVVLGGSTETVNAGGGTGLVQAVAGYAKTAVIGNTTSSTTLQFTNAGTIVLNASDTDLTVALSGSSNLTLGAGALIAAVGSSANDTITAGGAQQTLTGGLGTDSLIGSQADGDTFLDTSAGLNGDSITNFGGSDAIDISNLAFASLTESYAGSTTKGTLTLGDGTNKLAITIVGNYTPASFSFASDGHAGTSVLFK